MSHDAAHNGHAEHAGPLVVVGDALLDVDVFGHADRLAPDAPVPVVERADRRHRPGGAALAALLAADDGHDVVLVSAVADDAAGHRLRELLERRLDVLALPMRGATPVKTRIWAGGQALLRLDEGDGHTLDGRELDPRVTTAVREAGAVLVSDYGRGVAAHAGLRAGFAARPRHVPLVWDPHPRGASPIEGADVVTPNETEAGLLSVSDADATEARTLGERAAELRARWRSAAVAVTIGPRGAVLAEGDTTPRHVPTARTVPTRDACGAGDRFAATVTAALGDGMSVTDAVRLAGETASHFVAAGGARELTTAAGRRERREHATRCWGSSPPGDPVEFVAAVRAAGGRVVATGGCFDMLHAGHTSLLRRARALGECLVVCVNDDASVRRLKGPGRPIMPMRDRVQLLEALECVDAVLVFSGDTPAEPLRRLRPDVWVKGGDYEGRYLPETHVVHRYGGEIVVLPHLVKRSTTRLVAAIRDTR